jgi:adenylyltransferase/sulfurtransferase
VVELSNLNRQIVHDESFLHHKKTESAAFRLKRMNEDLEIQTYPEKFTEALALQIMPLYDIIVDCVDNYETRQLVSRMATELNVPLIEGGIEGFHGYVQIIMPHKTACFNCLGISQSPIQRQVVGAGVSTIGSIQALECIKILTNKWQGTYDYIALDLLTYEVETLFLRPNPNCTCHTNEMES